MGEDCLIEIPNFISRLDFWGELIDLFGLMVLLSNDVDVLARLHKAVMLIPHLQRLDRLRSEIHNGVLHFIQGFPAPYAEERLATFSRKDASAFIRLFPNRQDALQVANVDAIAVNMTANVQRLSVAIYAAEVTVGPINPDQAPMVGPIPYTEFANQIERQKQNVVYTAGFTLMALGSLLIVFQIMLQ